MLQRAQSLLGFHRSADSYLLENTTKLTQVFSQRKKKVMSIFTKLNKSAQYLIKKWKEKLKKKREIHSACSEGAYYLVSG